MGSLLAPALPGTGAAHAPFGWAETARALLADRPVALVTILAAEGSTPLGPGARMVVLANGLAAGSVGGGALEATALAQGRAILAHPPGTWRVQDYPLGPLLGQCCGGRVRLLVERLDPMNAGWLGDLAPGFHIEARLDEHGVHRRVVPPQEAPAPHSAKAPRPGVGAILLEPLRGRARPVLLFGAGHVGMALASVLAPLPFDLHWYDSRPAFAHGGVTLADEDGLEAAIHAAPGHSAILIMTHDHALDYRLTRAGLERAAALVGVIGSATKRARFAARLEREGLGDLAPSLTCPIGVAGITGKDPAVIAIAVAAQLLMLETN
ncbi:MAG: xanthine dehydrogenase accessory protein XdhC [Sphingomonadales bacterium]|nr:xanthine dehydrogenase accessory protein XdhC [Sphingomonadales bacterium]MDE2168125.1 xanthine dehydrogenase accessory protein XdhC [Sphingomonadales bacterium]